MRTLVSLAILLLVCPASFAQDKSGKVRYQAQVFRLTGNFGKQTSLSSPVWAGKPEDWDKIKNEITLFDLGEFKIGSNRLKIGRKGCFWDDFKLTFEDGFKAKLPVDRIKMIYSPNVLRKENELVRMKIESKQPFEYMKSVGHGEYHLKKITLPVGMDIEVKANAEGENMLLVSNLKIELRMVNRRESVAGTQLAVGKPELDTYSYRLKLKVREHKNYGILIQPKGSQAAIIVRLEIDDR